MGRLDTWAEGQGVAGVFDQRNKFAEDSQVGQLGCPRFKITKTRRKYEEIWQKNQLPNLF